MHLFSVAQSHLYNYSLCIVSLIKVLSLDMLSYPSSVQLKGYLGMQH